MDFGAVSGKAYLSALVVRMSIFGLKILQCTCNRVVVVVKNKKKESRSTDTDLNRGNFPGYYPALNVICTFSLVGMRYPGSSIHMV